MLGHVVVCVMAGYNEEDKEKVIIYVVAFWKHNETYDDAEDFELTKHDLGADI